MSGTIIHPSAVVSDRARLGINCRVGPFCVIDADVVIGDNNTFYANVVITGKTTVGAGNLFYPGAVLGAEPQRSEGFKDGKLTVGNRNVFREGFTAQGSGVVDGLTSIGDGGRFLAHSHVGHDSRIGNGVVVGNGTAIAGHVFVEDRAFLSGLVAVHQHVSIGELALVSAGSFVDRSVLPFTIADGHRVRVRAHNRIGLIRAGWEAEEIEAARSLVRAYRELGVRVFDYHPLISSYAGHAWAEFHSKTSRNLAPSSRRRPANG